MKPSRCSLLSLLGLAGLALAVEPNTMEDYVVRRGQTVSYIAFIKYGAYNDSIGGMLRKDNPQVQDLDKIQVGQVIKLRKEAKAPVVTEKEPARRIQLASRKAVVTMVQGSGEIRRFKGKREPLQANRFLSMGDTIVTGADGFAELIIDNQSILRLSSATEVRLTAIQEPSKVTSKESRSLVTTFFLARGKPGPRSRSGLAVWCDTRSRCPRPWQVCTERSSKTKSRTTPPPWWPSIRARWVSRADPPRKLPKKGGLPRRCRDPRRSPSPNGYRC